jgi:NADH-quinone oxidoreductase subunit J
MIETVLQNLQSFMLVLFAIFALVGAVLMLVVRQPMRVAMALIATMLSLGAIYGLLGVHFIAAFQVLIYVGAVMVFMVYAIMLLDLREAAERRYSRLLLPGVAGFVLFIGIVGIALWRSLPSYPETDASAAFGVGAFSVSFLNDYWLHFELTSVLLVVAVVAAVAVIRLNRRLDAKRRHG